MNDEEKTLDGLMGFLEQRREWAIEQQNEASTYHQFAGVSTYLTGLNQVIQLVREYIGEEEDDNLFEDSPEEECQNWLWG